MWTFNIVHKVYNEEWRLRAFLVERERVDGAWVHGGCERVNAIVFWGWPQFSKTVSHGHSHCGVKYARRLFFSPPACTVWPMHSVV